MATFTENPLTMSLSGKNKTLQIVIHTFGWGLIFCAPLFFTYANNSTISLSKYLDFCVVPLTFITLFYTNYFWLIRKFLFRKELGKYILINLVLIVTANLVQHFWHEFFHTFTAMTEPKRGGVPPPRYVFIISHSVMMMLVIGLAVAIRATNNWYHTQAEKQKIETERTQAELKNLKSQLNPHFLFNTLNNIYALIQVAPPQAQYAVHSLSNLLRYVLYEDNGNLIPLDKEFAFMKNYIELMSLRLSSDRVKLTVNIPDDGKGLLVAPLLFITLVENAFKHGISPSEPSFVRIEMHIDEEAHTLDCRVENSYFPKTERDRSGSGIGLQNLRKRLDLIYPNRHILRTEPMGKIYISQLIINL